MFEWIFMEFHVELSVSLSVCLSVILWNLEVLTHLKIRVRTNKQTNELSDNVTS